MPGRSIRIFLPDGSPVGLRLASLGLSTVRCVVAPRGMLTELAKREEARRTGVYFLTGPDPELSGRACVYIGEGDDVLGRLKEHNKDDSKGFWDTAYLFVSKDDGLTKAHVRWLEARSVEDLHSAKRARVTNTTSPVGGNLPEADLAEMAELLDQIKLLLPMLGFSGFEPSGVSMPPATPVENLMQFSYAGGGYRATGHWADGNFVVRRGAMFRREEVPTLARSSKEVRAALRQSDILRERDDGWELTQDYSFNSASQAAEAVCGFSVNGRVAWKTTAGHTLGEWQDSLLEATVTQRAVQRLNDY